MVHGIYDSVEKECLAMFDVTEEACCKIFDLAINNACYFRIDTTSGRYTNSKNFFRKYEVVVENKEFFDIFKRETVLQISIGAETEEELIKFKKILQQESILDIKVEDIFLNPFPHGKVWTMSIINKNASKGNAVSGLCKFLKIDVNDAIAFGDATNDISMLKTVGLGVAMGNASCDVKKIAKEITLTNIENGVAKIINSKI